MEMVFEETVLEKCPDFLKTANHDAHKPQIEQTEKIIPTCHVIQLLKNQWWREKNLKKQQEEKKTCYRGTKITSEDFCPELV